MFSTLLEFCIRIKSERPHTHTHIYFHLHTCIAQDNTLSLLPLWTHRITSHRMFKKLNIVLSIAVCLVLLCCLSAAADEKTHKVCHCDNVDDNDDNVVVVDIYSTMMYVCMALQNFPPSHHTTPHHITSHHSTSCQSPSLCTRVMPVRETTHTRCTASTIFRSAGRAVSSSTSPSHWGRHCRACRS